MIPEPAVAPGSAVTPEDGLVGLIFVRLGHQSAIGRDRPSRRLRRLMLYLITQVPGQAYSRAIVSQVSGLRALDSMCPLLVRS